TQPAVINEKLIRDGVDDERTHQRGDRKQDAQREDVARADAYTVRSQGPTGVIVHPATREKAKAVNRACPAATVRCPEDVRRENVERTSRNPAMRPEPGERQIIRVRRAQID